MTVKVGIPTIQINSWREFVKEVEIHSEREWIYRGQSDSDWELKSSFHRLFERLKKIFRDGGIRGNLQTRDRHERKLLDSFRYKAHLFIKDLPHRDADYNIECLSIMQHHGTPTRLLDMTFSPYVAAFFALEEGEKDCAVFAIKHSYFKKFDENRFGKNEYKKKLRKYIRDLKGTKKELFFIPYEPKLHTERLVAQQGLFFVGSSNYYDHERILQNYTNLGEGLIKYILPKSIRYEGLKKLKQMNITAATLFPGFDGFCRSLQYQCLADPKILGRMGIPRA